MTIRYPIECTTCQQGITLRISLGTQKKQNIAISCPQCKQKISLLLTTDKSSENYQPNIEIQENGRCSIENKDFKILNLHTELIYPKHMINESIMLPQGMINIELYEYAQNKGIVGSLKKAKKSSNPFGFNMRSLFDELGGDSYLLEDWECIYKAYSLYENEMFELMEKELQNYSKIHTVYNNGSLIYSIVFDFLLRFIAPNTILYNEIKNILNKAKNKKSKFQKFRIYYKDELFNLHWKNYIDIFNEYFKNFSEFNRLLLNTKIELYPEESEYIFCPVNFDEVKMFYGNAYEYITTHITIFACINNIINNRNFDTFERMNLIKYNKLNKESKSGPLQSNEIFKKFTENLESSWRNASHHKWFYIDKNNPGWLLYRSGGTGALNKISYINYIYKSNQLMMNIALMAMIEIKFLIK